MLLPFPVSYSLASLYEKDFTEFDLVFIGRDGELSVASAPLARRQTPSSAAAAPAATSESLGTKFLHGAEDVLGIAGPLLLDSEERRDSELSVTSAPLARRQTPSSAAAAPAATSESLGTKLLHGAEDVLGVAGPLLLDSEERRDSELSVVSAPLARRQTPSSAAAAPAATSESLGTKFLHGAEDVLGVAGPLLFDAEERK